MWIIGRTKTDGPPDYDAVHKIQAGFKITPLSRWGKKPEPVRVKIDKVIDMKTPPKLQVDTMPAGRFFAIAAELLKRQPPHITDEPIIARLKRIGFDAGKSFDINRHDPSIRIALATVPDDAQMQWKPPTIAQVVNGWSMNTDTIGVYGNYYLKRAIVVGDVPLDVEKREAGVATQPLWFGQDARSMKRLLPCERRALSGEVEAACKP